MSSRSLSRRAGVSSYVNRPWSARNHLTGLIRSVRPADTPYLPSDRCRNRRTGRRKPFSNGAFRNDACIRTEHLATRKHKIVAGAASDSCAWRKSPIAKTEPDKPDNRSRSQHDNGPCGAMTYVLLSYNADEQRAQRGYLSIPGSARWSAPPDRCVYVDPHSSCHPLGIRAAHYVIIISPTTPDEEPLAKPDWHRKAA